MPRTPRLTRLVSAVVTFALAMTGLATIGTAGAAPAAAENVLVYDSMPAVAPASYLSQPFQAQSVDEFGDFVKLGGTDRHLTGVSVGFTTWACEDWQSATPCAAPLSDPAAYWEHPITLNIYEVDNSGTVPVAGALYTSITETKQIPFRPGKGEACTGTQWQSAEGCRNGMAFNLGFDLSAQGLTVSDDIIVSIAFNTKSHGAVPVGASGPHESLNVSLASAAPTVGTDEDSSEMFIDTSHAPFYGDGGVGGVDTFRADSGWIAGQTGLVLEIAADNELIPAATDVTVYQKDVKSSETSATYTQWHEGKNNPTPAYSVKTDGLHLGDGASSTIIKGTDVVASEISRADLRRYILEASVDVVSLTDEVGMAPTFQVPLYFGSALNAGTFTTLQTSLEVGHNTFSLNVPDSWRTSKAFGPYPNQQSAATLTSFLDSIYAGGNKVWLFGYGVQANKSAVISAVTFNGTRYSFFQPEIQSCTPVAGPVASSADANGWTFGETRADGRNTFTAEGLHVETFGTSAGLSQAKAAGYRATSIPLAEVGTVGIEFADGWTGTRPSLQLRVDTSGDGISDGTIVGEPWAYGGGDWSMTNNGNWDDAKFWSSANFGIASGLGYASFGTLDDYLAAHPTATVVSYGYSLGSGIHGDAVIESITVGCESSTFTISDQAVSGSTVYVNEYDIRANATPYTGWHEGYTNAVRAYSVDEDGLQFGSPTRSQILLGFDAPIANADIESLFTSANTEVVSGNVALQFPLYYGDTNRFTTMRLENLNTPGVHGTTVTNVWVSSSAIRNNAGNQVLPSGAKLPLADWAALFASMGAVNVLGVAVQADYPAAVASVTANGTTHLFVPFDAAEISETVVVAEAEIALDESTYAGWHEGYANATPAFTVEQDGLVLATGAPSQIIKGFDAPVSSPSVGQQIAGASVTVVDGSVTFQVPLFYGAGTDFVTLRSVGLEAGTHTFDLSSSFQTSKTIGSIAANQSYPLATILDALTNVRVLAFGVQADDEATVSRIVWDTVEYQFDGDITGTVPVVSGVATVGETLTADAGAWTPAGVALAFQWNADGDPISGATSSSYELTGLELGKTITVTVTGSLDGYDAVAKTSSDLGPVAAATLTTVVPTVSGTPAIGEELTADGGSWAPAPVVLAYQWLRSGSPISGATASTYTVSAADSGSKLSVRVSGVKLGFTSASEVSTQSGYVPFVDSAVLTTEIVREAEIALTATPYEGWHEGYPNVAPAYGVVEAGLQLGTGTSSQIIKGLDAPLTSPSLGELISGAAVTVVEGSATFQVPLFYGSGSDFTTLRSVSLAAGTHSFTVDSLFVSSRTIGSIVKNEAYPLGDILAELTDVRVLAFGVQADAQATVSRIVWDTVQYQFDGPMETTVPVISGVAAIGQTLTATSDPWSPAPVALTYEWLRNGVAITGATGSTYGVVAEDATATISVRVTGVKAGYTTATATSIPTAEVPNGTIAPSAVSITGAATVGSTLTATTSPWGPAPVVLTYQWLANGIAIPGATASTYTVVEGDGGDKLSVRVLGTKAGYTAIAATSSETSAVPYLEVAVQRLWGSDRYATAIDISNEFAPNVERVYLATGANYADALSAAPAAAQFDGPVLLTRPDMLPADVKAELTRLAPSEVIIVGATGAVSVAVANAVEALSFSPDVTRIGGIDRYETSRLIAAEAFPSADTAYLATGANFPDALAAGPAAAHFGGPVVLIPGTTTTVDVATIALLTSLGVDEVKLAGSTGVISHSIDLQLRANFDTTRNGGADRYDTAIQINADEFTSADTIYLATGLNFPDALAGAALAGSQGAPLFIATTECIPSAVLSAMMDLNPAKVVLLGGTGTLSVNIEDLTACG